MYAGTVPCSPLYYHLHHHWTVCAFFAIDSADIVSDRPTTEIHEDVPVIQHEEGEDMAGYLIAKSGKAPCVSQSVGPRYYVDYIILLN
jgi:hypothetical protein